MVDYATDASGNTATEGVRPAAVTVNDDSMDEDTEVFRVTRSLPAATVRLGWHGLTEGAPWSIQRAHGDGHRAVPRAGAVTGTLFGVDHGPLPCRAPPELLRTAVGDRAPPQSLTEGSDAGTCSRCNSTWRAGRGDATANRRSICAAGAGHGDHQRMPRGEGAPHVVAQHVTSTVAGAGDEHADLLTPG